MHAPSRLVIACVVVCGAVLSPGRAEAGGPRNPYSSFNLSGINYGAQQWERAQREGRRVWPSYNAPARPRPAGSNAGVSGFAGTGGRGLVRGGANHRTGMRRTRR